MTERQYLTKLYKSQRGDTKKANSPSNCTISGPASCNCNKTSPQTLKTCSALPALEEELDCTKIARSLDCHQRKVRLK
eukprot:3940332-Rhodomonas_salina.3